MVGLGSGEAQGLARREGEGRTDWARIPGDLTAPGVPSLQSLPWPAALAPAPWQPDVQRPQVELSDCRIFFQGQREHIVSFHFPSV